MKRLIFGIIFLLSAARAIFAAPVQVHNKLVFTRGELALQTEVVWTMNPDGSGATQAWRVPKGYGNFGGFSHDGKQAISYNRFNLYVHNLKTNRFRRVLLWSGGWSPLISDVAFSPDDKHIVCTVSSSSSGRNEAHILVLDVNKTYSIRNGYNSVMNAQVRPTDTDLQKFPYFQDVSWSSDTSRLVCVGGTWRFDELSANELEIWMMNSDGSQGHQLTDNRFWESQPIWSISAKKVAFTRFYNDSKGENSPYARLGSDLFVINDDGTDEKRLTRNRRDSKDRIQVFRLVSNPVFSVDGTRIAFNLRNTDSAPSASTQAQRILFYQDWIHITDIDGSNQKQLAQGTLVQWLP